MASLAACTKAAPQVAPDAGVADPFGGSACAVCVLQACAPSITQCDADPECSSYLACLEACPVQADGNVSAACASQCPSPESSFGAAAVGTLEACRVSGLGSVCGACFTTEGASASILHQVCAPPIDPSQCGYCLGQSCCNTEALCNAIPECGALVACVDQCGDTQTQCELACYAAHPDGQQAYASQQACNSVLCSADCGVELTDCESCALSTCLTSYVDLLASPSGRQVELCLLGCSSGDTLCPGNCFAAYPAGAALYKAYSACAVQCSACQP